MADIIAIYITVLTWGLPPFIIRLPLKRPLSLVTGATPTREEACLLVIKPSSGTLLIREAARTFPTPGMLWRMVLLAWYSGLLSISLAIFASTFSSWFFRAVRIGVMVDEIFLGNIYSRFLSMVCMVSSWFRLVTKSLIRRIFSLFSLVSSGWTLSA